MSTPPPPPSPAPPTRKPSRDRRPVYSEKSPRITQATSLLPTHRDEADFADGINTATTTTGSTNPLRAYHDEQKHRLHLHPTASKQQQQQQYRQKLGLKRTRSMPPFLRTEGESGRNGFHPLHFLRIIWRSSSIVSSYVNILWPVVPAALTVRYVRPDWHLTIFILSYVRETSRPHVPTPEDMAAAANMCFFEDRHGTVRQSSGLCGTRARA